MSETTMTVRQLKSYLNALPQGCEDKEVWIEMNGGEFVLLRPAESWAIEEEGRVTILASFAPEGVIS